MTMTNPEKSCTVGAYLVKRLEEAGVKHVFGIPGDYVLSFSSQIAQSSIQWVGTCNELNAGYAADGYARLTGLGVVVVTYAAGGLSAINAIAGAYAEQVPVLLISGAPPAARRSAKAMVHHLISDYELQYDIYRKVTVDAAMLVDPQTAPDAIDRVIASCRSQKKPAYLELPADIINAPCRAPGPLPPQVQQPSDPDTLAECIAESAALLDAAQNPVVIAGMELLRFGIARKTLDLIERIELPFATTISSKSILPELHPQFIGIYQGALSREIVREQLERSDCVLTLGMWMTDVDTGIFSMEIDPRRLISASFGTVQISRHTYPNVALDDFIPALANALTPRSFLTSRPATPIMKKTVFHPQPQACLTVSRFFERLNSFLDDNMILLAEAGDSVFASSELYVEEPENFIAQAYYLSIGYCTPAALGVSLARPEKRPVVVTGDGAFQMTAQEVSTLLRFKCAPIIFLLNNGGYVTQRKFHIDGPYNEILNWHYHALPATFGDNCIGLRVITEDDLEDALDKAARVTDRLVFIELCFKRNDCSKLLEGLAAKIRLAAQKS